MAGFLLRRLVNYAVLIAVATSLAYMLAALALDPRSNYEGRNPRPPAAVVDAQLSLYNLNDRTPLVRRYLRWAGGVLRGDLGRTWNGDRVDAEVRRRVGVTLRLIVLGLVLGSVAGVLTGALAAVRQYGWFDRLSTMAAFVVLAVPTVVLANMLIIMAVWLNDRLGVQVFLVSGEHTPGLDGGVGAGLLDRVKHLALPTVSLALGQIAVYSRYQRNMMLDVLDADFVRTAMAKGLRRRTALVKHALRTALIPAVTYFAFTFGSLLVGATITESVFGWHGMGEELVASIRSNDVNMVAAISCFAALAVLTASLAADVLHAVLDPRVRVS
ncbi:peptide ABC transporter permease [Sphaerisporangium siamense]|uniref:Peptide/nickel transport system permease protein n=1 Tax=Sphaerisporangium siamense TaxID=795645 RepID=A0A7W7GA66_9ACTN|nr:ABC transporter permease [Sphaerisporangium siamense]MBB4702127.1 peptide/nickel transport system permease protein [Sphaerisporangium siamense]GII87181.1 peptide ABC transporter permease [Sphaerisporangium siamense]